MQSDHSLPVIVLYHLLVIVFDEEESFPFPYYTHLLFLVQSQQQCSILCHI